MFNIGVITLLKSKLLFLELQLVQCHSSFSQHIEIVSPPSAARTYVFDGSLELHQPLFQDISAEATLDQSVCPEEEDMEDKVGRLTDVNNSYYVGKIIHDIVELSWIHKTNNNFYNRSTV